MKGKLVIFVGCILSGIGCILSGIGIGMSISKRLQMG